MMPNVNSSSAAHSAPSQIDDGLDGLVGYLRWDGINRPASFLALLGRVLPTQLNIKSTTSLKVTYKTVEETRQALKDYGIEPAMVTEIFNLSPQKRLPPP
jgi:hypothetical protein